MWNWLWTRISRPIIFCRYDLNRLLPQERFKENREISPKTICVAIITKCKVKYKQACLFNVLSYQTASMFLQEECKIGYFKLFLGGA